MAKKKSFTREYISWLTHFLCSIILQYICYLFMYVVLRLNLNLCRVPKVVTSLSSDSLLSRGKRFINLNDHLWF